MDLDLDAEPSQFAQGRPVCAAFELPDDAIHTISVLVSVPPRDRQDEESSLSGFLFDYILVQPSSAASAWETGDHNLLLPILGVAVMNVTQDPTLNFGVDVFGKHMADATPDWAYDPSNGFHTTKPGSQFNVTFTGTSSHIAV